MAADLPNTDASRSLTFPMKLHSILISERWSDIIKFEADGKKWKILDKKRMEEEVLPLHFRHNKYLSFTRSVIGWGFKRVGKATYYHKLFNRNAPDLCSRKNKNPQKTKLSPGHLSNIMASEATRDLPVLYDSSEYGFVEISPADTLADVRRQMVEDWDDDMFPRDGSEWFFRVGGRRYTKKQEGRRRAWDLIGGEAVEIVGTGRPAAPFSAGGGACQRARADVVTSAALVSPAAVSVSPPPDLGGGRSAFADPVASTDRFCGVVDGREEGRGGVAPGPTEDAGWKRRAAPDAGGPAPGGTSASRNFEDRSPPGAPAQSAPSPPASPGLSAYGGGEREGRRLTAHNPCRPLKYTRATAVRHRLIEEPVDEDYGRHKREVLQQLYTESATAATNNGWVATMETDENCHICHYRRPLGISFPCPCVGHFYCEKHLEDRLGLSLDDALLSISHCPICALECKCNKCQVELRTIVMESVSASVMATNDTKKDCGFDETPGGVAVRDWQADCADAVNRTLLLKRKRKLTGSCGVRKRAAPSTQPPPPLLPPSSPSLSLAPPGKTPPCAEGTDTETFRRGIMEMLSTEDASIVSWQSSGDSFKVHDLDRFKSEVMPRYFGCSKISVFWRQLKVHGFLRVQHALGCYRHVLVHRDRAPHANGAEEEEFVDGNDATCHVCKGFGSLVCCDKCPRAFHAACLPINEAVRDDNWTCHVCEKETFPQACDLLSSAAYVPAMERVFGKLSVKQDGRRYLIVLSRLAEMVAVLAAYDYGGVFGEPVDLSENNTYLKQVERPMDLGTIAAKLVDPGGEYFRAGVLSLFGTVHAVLRDVQTIWDNCYLFNQKKSVIYRMGEVMERKCNNIIVASIQNYFSPEENKSLGKFLKCCQSSFSYDLSEISDDQKPPEKSVGSPALAPGLQWNSAGYTVRSSGSGSLTIPPWNPGRYAIQCSALSTQTVWGQERLCESTPARSVSGAVRAGTAQAPALEPPAEAATPADDAGKMRAGEEEDHTLDLEMIEVETFDEKLKCRLQEVTNRGEDFDLCEEDRGIEDARVGSNICPGIDVKLELCPSISNSAIASVAPPDSCLLSDQIYVSERTDFGQREMSTSFERPGVPETVRAVELSAKTERLSAAVGASVEAAEAAETVLTHL